MTTTTELERRPEDESAEELALADLDLSDEKAGEISGGTRPPCDDWGCGTNHNEVLALTTQAQRRDEDERELDLEVPDETAGEITGGIRPPCEEWGCGSNHNEVLALTPPSHTPQAQQREEAERELDLELPDETAGEVTGGTRPPCEEWGCGMNHNEVLALTS